MGWIIAGQCIMIVGLITTGVLAWAAWSTQIIRKNSRILGFEIQVRELKLLLLTGLDALREGYTEQWPDNFIWDRDGTLLFEAINKMRVAVDAPPYTEDEINDIAMIQGFIASEREIVDKDE